jgi:hypothetical protein
MVIIQNIFFVLLTLAVSYKEKSAKDEFVLKDKSFKNILDTSKFAILSFETSGKIGFNKNYSPATLSDSDLLGLDVLIYQSIQKYNSGLKKESFQYRGIDTVKFHYKMQIIPALNHKGQKEIWINGFCSHWNGSLEPFRKDWKKQLVSVKDGGNCYFNFKINLATKKYYAFSVNGYA